MDFKTFATAINKQYKQMERSDLYKVSVTKNELWDVYLKSFPEGSNPIYKERTQHDCVCCKNFIRDLGSVVSIKNNKLVTIWDVSLEGVYGDVVKSLREYITTKMIDSRFLAICNKSGAETTYQEVEDGDNIKWNHFHADIKREYVDTRTQNQVIGGTKVKSKVFERGLKEITLDSLETVLDLISSNNLYRGEEHQKSIKDFKQLKVKYLKLETEQEKNIFVWSNLSNRSSLIRNTSIGTLLIDLSDDEVDLEKSVGKYESMMAPSNYKRSKSLITKSMITNAVKTIRDLGYEESLKRRYARIEDISVNDVLFVDRNYSPLMKDSLTDSLMAQVTSKPITDKNGEDISIDDFMEKVLPRSSSIEVQVENCHEKNLVSLIAPDDKDSKNILKWNNNFSWSYEGNTTDSIKEKVRKAGGSVTGDVRVSLSWFNTDDLDIHVIQPNKTHISYSNKRSGGCELDIDMNAGGNFSTTPVENITWDKFNNMMDGKYKVFVHNYTKRNTTDVGFEIEVDIKGDSSIYSYTLPVGDKKNVITFYLVKKGDKLTIEGINSKLSGGSHSKEIWGVKTNEFVPVKCINFSPNYWEGNKTGNKHFMFMLKDCVRPEKAKGLYNEFLNPELHDHRKVFEIMSDTIKCDDSEEQLSGLGFSSTMRNKLICNVHGELNKQYNIIF